MDIHKIKYEIDNAPHRMKGAIAQGYAEKMGISRNALYRRIRKEYGAQRKILGKPIIDRNLIDEIAKIKIYGMNIGEHDRELSTEECIKILKERDVKGADKLKVSTVNRILRQEKGLRLRDKIVRVEAEYPNQTHQLDFSRSKYFQVHKYDYEKGDYILKVSGKSLSYKENETKLRTWVVGITDTYSRISLAMAFAATGESEAIGLEFLRFVYNRPEDAHPLRLRPKTLKTDNGAFIKSKATKNLLKALDIKSELVKPYKKRGIQKREAAWRMIWQRFELPLAVQLQAGTEIYLSDYNELLHEKMIELLEWEHPTRAKSRVHVYNAGLPLTKPREIKVDLNDIIYRVIERTVNQACQVSIDKKLYEVHINKNGKYNIAIGKRIRIYYNGAGEFMGELIDEYHKPFKLTPTDGYVTEGDFSHRRPATYREQMEKQIEQSEKRQQQEELGKLPPKIKYMPVQSTEQQPDTVFHNNAEEELSELELKAYFGTELAKEGLDIFDYIKEFEDLYNELGHNYFTKEIIKDLVKQLKTDKAAVNH